MLSAVGQQQMEDVIGSYLYTELMPWHVGWGGGLGQCGVREDSSWSGQQFHVP